MHSESIHRYRRPSRLVVVTASRNVLGRLLTGILERRLRRVAILVVAHSGIDDPQQWESATYLKSCGIWKAVSINRGDLPWLATSTSLVGTKVVS